MKQKRKGKKKKKTWAKLNKTSVSNIVGNSGPFFFTAHFIVFWGAFASAQLPLKDFIWSEVLTCLERFQLVNKLFCGPFTTLSRMMYSNNCFSKSIANVFFSWHLSLSLGKDMPANHQNNCFYKSLHTHTHQAGQWLSAPGCNLQILWKQSGDTWYYPHYFCSLFLAELFLCK